MEIRESIQREKPAIRKLHKGAFGDIEGESVSALAISILNDESAQPVLSLVAMHGEEIVGNIIFSAARVEGMEEIQGSILAPLAVRPDLQGKGIGTDLILKGLALIKQRGSGFVLVYGDPGYYKRTGFRSNTKLTPPYKVDYPEAWMSRELEHGVLDRLEGNTLLCQSLGSPQYW